MVVVHMYDFFAKCEDTGSASLRVMRGTTPSYFVRLGWQGVVSIPIEAQ